MLDFFTTFWHWLLELPEHLSEAFAYLMTELKIIFYELLTSIVESATLLFLGFTQSTTYLSTFENSYGLLSNDTKYALEALNIPEAVILIVSSMSLRFAIKLIPGI